MKCNSYGIISKMNRKMLVVILVVVVVFFAAGFYYFSKPAPDEQSNTTIEPDININGESGVIFLHWPSSYTINWIVPSNGNCIMYGYFGDQSQGSIWKDVKESGSLTISNLPDPDISKINDYAYALECSQEGIQVGDSVQLKVVKEL